MDAEKFFNEKAIIDVSFYNFRNAITAAYFANKDMEVVRVNKNFKKFFPIAGNVSNMLLPDVLAQIGIPEEQIQNFVSELKEKGSVLIPQVTIAVNGEDRVYSLLSTQTHDDDFSYLNGFQGQFVDRTQEWKLKKEREELLEQKVQDRQLIEEKSQQLESLAMRLAKYLSPQIYQAIFSETENTDRTYKRKNLTIFFSDIVQFTDLTDSLEPERLALVINSYLSEMSNIAINCGGTIDKFIGDAILIFFGDPESEGDVGDAINCLEMAIQMQKRIAELQKFWKKNGVSAGIKVRMGIATGFCTVGNFGSDKRLDYTVLGTPVNLAARLQTSASADTILIDENTHNLVGDQVACKPHSEITPKGFSRAIKTFQVGDFLSDQHRDKRRKLSHVSDHVEVNVTDSSNIRAAIEELRQIQISFENQLNQIDSE